MCTMKQKCCLGGGYCLVLMLWSLIAHADEPGLTEDEFNRQYNAIRSAYFMSPADSEQAYFSIYQQIKDSPALEQIALLAIQLHLHTTIQRKSEAAADWLSLAEGTLKQLDSEASVNAAQLMIKRNQLLFLMMTGQYVKLIGQINAIEKQLAVTETASHLHLTDQQMVLDEADVARIYLLFGGALYYTSDFDAAQKYIHKSLEINRAINNLKGAADGYNNLALIAMEEQMYESATDFLNESLAIVKQIGDTEQYITFLTNQGVNFKGMGKHDAAIESFNQVINHPDINQYRGYQIHSLLMLADMAMDNDLAAADQFIQQANDVAQAMQTGQAVWAKINGQLAQLKQRQGLHTEAIELTEKNLQYYNDNNKRSEVAESHWVLSNSYQKLGQWQQAYQHFKTYADLSQQIAQNATKNSVARLHHQYKENAAAERIALLQTENLLQTVELEANKKEKMVMAVGSGFALLILLLLVSRHYIKKEAQRLARHNAQIAAREKQLNLLSHAFKSTSDAVWITNDRFEIEDVNDSFLKHTLQKKQQVIGKPLLLAPVKGQDEYMSDHIKNQISLHGTWRGELYDQRADGQVYPLELEVDTIYNQAGEVIHYLGVFRDITEKKLAEQELQNLATHDDLTGLPNRTLLLQLLQQAVANVKSSALALATLLVDVGGFKKVSNTVGHAVGDALIATVVERIKATLSADEVLARISESTFAVLVEAAEAKIEAVRVALEINAAFGSALVVHNKPYMMSVSMGIAVCPDDGGEAEDLLRKASIAVVDGKNKHDLPYNFFKHHMNEVIMAQLSHEQRVIHAINNDSFEFHYQPLHDVSTGQVIGAEALIRWVEVDGSVILPDQFIDIAERAGFIDQIDKIVLERVFGQVAQWRREAALTLGMVSINLSAGIFSRPKDLLPLLAKKISKHDIDPREIKIEITESMLLQDMDQAIETINQIKNMGFQIALDDFGTGYSSLNYLKKFAVDFLKIDRSFITSIHQSKVDQNIVKTIIELANTLNLKVIAEGVECAQHVAILKAMNCDYCQGYYFSKPLPKKRFEAFVAV